MQNALQIAEVQSQPSGGRFQFSVRDLLRLMLVMSIVLGTGVGMARADHASWLWLWLATGAVVVVWYYGRWERLLKISVGRSIWWYFLSLLLPALRMEADTIVGAYAWLLSYWMGIALLPELLTRSQPGLGSIGAVWPLTCVAGAVANTLVILGWIGFFVARRMRRSAAVFRWAARVAAALMVACILPFVFSGGPTVIDPGYVLWLASAVVLGAVGRSDNGPVGGGSRTGGGQDRRACLAG